MECICGKTFELQAGLETCLRSHLVKVRGRSAFARAGCQNELWSECWCDNFGFMHDLEFNALALSRHMLEEPEGILAHYLACQLESR